MPRAESEAVLSRVGWLAAQSPDFRERVLEACDFRRIPAGTAIYALGDAPGGLYGLAAGLVDVLIAPGPFTPMLAHIAMPGWWVGEAALVTQTRRRAELTARTEVDLMHIPDSRIEGIAADDPSTWRRLAELTVHHLDMALSLAGCLASRDLRLRLLVTLHRLVAHAAHANRVIELPVSQRELGELTALSRNKIGRLLAQLEAEKLVSHRYGRLVVCPDRLRAALAA